MASHAQKYFIRLNSQNKKDKRRVRNEWCEEQHGGIWVFWVHQNGGWKMDAWWGLQAAEQQGRAARECKQQLFPTHVSSR